MGIGRRMLLLGVVGVLLLGLIVGTVMQSRSGSEREATSSGSTGAAMATAAAGKASMPSSAASSDAARAVSGGATSSAALPAAQANVSALPSDWDRKIVRSADLTLTVDKVEDAVALARRVVTDAGGSVFASSTSFEGKYQIASLTVDVPSDRFDSVMTALRTGQGIVRVERETTTSQDVTDEYLDLQARQRNLSATEARYLALMDKATKLEDVLQLERELSRVRGDIEQVTGRIKFLDQRTQFSRITLALRPEAAPVAATGPAWNLAHAVDRAWNASLRFTGTIARGIVTILVFFWWLWPLAVVAGFAFRSLRARRRGETEASTGA